MKKKVLILTADAGFGHRSAANAIAEALSEKGEFELDVRIENLLNDPATPAALRNTQTDYDKIVTEMPRLYEFGYKNSDTPILTQIAQVGLSAMLYKPLSKVMQDFDPDVVVSTYPLYQGPAQSWYLMNEETWRSDKTDKKDATNTTPLNRKHKPYITVITDLVSVHQIWMSTLPDYYCVATEEMRDFTAKFGISREKILSTGIPVKPVYSEERRTKAELRKSLNWDTQKTTLIAVGSKRVNHLLESLDVINHANFDLQLILVAGGADNLYDKMIQTDWHLPVKVYNFTDELPIMLLASDMIITKAGGLITSESLAAGLPMLLIDVLPGQEEGNAQYIVENNAGALIEKPLDVLYALKHWLMDDQKELKNVTNKMKIIGKPHSSLDIADLIIAQLTK